MVADTFWPSVESSRQVHEKVPVRMAVDSRPPSGPKRLPRNPMAAGMKSSRPGNCRRVLSKPAMVNPVMRLVLAESMRATRLWLASPLAGPSKPPNGRHVRRGTERGTPARTRDATRGRSPAI